MQEWLDKAKNLFSERGKTVLVTGAAVVLLLTVAVTASLLLGSHDKLRGRWALDSVTVYEFRGSGRGAMVLDSGEYPFSYRTEGDRLIVDFVSDAATDREYTYSVKDGVLTLTDGAQTYRMRRVKE